jgi:hypothetical protein
MGNCLHRSLFPGPTESTGAAALSSSSATATADFLPQLLNGWLRFNGMPTFTGHFHLESPCFTYAGALMHADMIKDLGQS